MPFIDTLIEIRNGGAAIEMQESLEKLIKAVRETGKGGKVQLTLAVKPATKGDDVDMVFVTDAITTTIPKPSKKDTVFFVSEENQLTRKDQRQLEMLDGIRDLNDQPRQAPKEVR